MSIPQILAYLMVSVFIASAFLLILSGPIVDWLYAREKRKKAAAAAKAATAESAAMAADADGAAAKPA